MTVTQLLAWILAALFLQMALGVAMALWRRQADVLTTKAPAPNAPPEPALPSAWSGTRAFRVSGKCFEDTSQSQCSFLLEPVDGLALPPFKPGQFLTFVLQLPDAAAPGETRPLVRCYSLSDRPDPARYRVTIKRVAAARADWPPGLCSNHFHDRVQVGDVLQLKAPSGHFHIDTDTDTNTNNGTDADTDGAAGASVPVVLVAGGIGITPMMSMLRWWLAARPQRPLTLYYGVRHGGEHAFKTVLEDIAAAYPQVQLHVVYSQPGPNDRPGVDFQHVGHVDAELLRRTLPHGRHLFYVCGPKAMMETLVPALHDWGVRDADIHFEAFGPATVRRAGAAAAQAPGEPVDVQWRSSGRTLAWDGSDDNLLEFAERHGVAVSSGCRSGSCGSCETPLVSGKVVYASQPDHDVAAGHCLLCVGRPASALVLDA